MDQEKIEAVENIIKCVPPLTPAAAARRVLEALEKIDRERAPVACLPGRVIEGRLEHGRAPELTVQLLTDLHLPLLGYGTRIQLLVEETPEQRAKRERRKRRIKAIEDTGRPDYVAKIIVDAIEKADSEC